MKNYMIIAKAENSDGELVNYYSIEIQASDKIEALSIAADKWPGMKKYKAIKLK